MVFQQNSYLTRTFHGRGHYDFPPYSILASDDMNTVMNALANFKGNTTALLGLLAVLPLSLLVACSDPASDYIDQGYIHLRAEQYDEAIANYDIALGLDPENAEVHVNRGAAYASQGKYGLAIADYSFAVELDPENSIAYYNRGRAYAQQGDYVSAINDLNVSIVLSPYDGNAYNLRGFAYIQQGNYEPGIDDINQAIRFGTEDEHLAYYHRGSAYALQMQYKLAIEDFSSAIALSNEDSIAAEVYAARGRVLLEMGNRAEGIEDLSKARQLGYDR